MAVENVREFQSCPPFFPMYLRAAFGSRPKLNPRQPLPALQARLNGISVDAARLKAYNETCGYADVDSVPLMFPHVLSAPLQLALISAPEFPVRMLGAIHQRNHILQRRTIKKGDVLDALVGIGQSRVVKQGMEFDVQVLMTSGGERIWESISTYLTRGKFGDFVEPPAIANMPEFEAAQCEAAWSVGKDMGRRYAKVSGDYNLIHLSTLAAKAFGFPRAFIHGMWSTSASLAHLPEQVRVNELPLRYDVAFKGPIFLGSKVTMQCARIENGTRFDLFCQNNPRPCVRGLLRHADNPENLF